MNGLPITEQERQQILDLIKQIPPAEICRRLKRAPSTVYNILRGKGINTRSIKSDRYWERWKENEQAKLLAEHRPVMAAQSRKTKKAAPEPFKRPPAQYSNTGFLSVTQKYAS